jgi:ATP-dependent DNA helicase DinG
MTDNPLLSYFPVTTTIKEIRPNQKEALDKIWNALQSGSKNITLCAPVGAGKSAIADTIFNYFNSIGKNCLYCSPMNNLVDQYESSGFKGVFTIKGRKHYPCLSGRENCEKGFCRTNKCPNTKHKRDCKESPYQECQGCMCWKCIYKLLFNKFKLSNKGNTNFTMFMLHATNDYDVLCIDECDTIESTIRDFNGVTIPFEVKHPHFEDHIEPLKKYIEEINAQVEKINPDQSDEEYKERERLLELASKAMAIIDDYELNQEDWCVSVDYEKKRTKYEPVTITRFIEPLLKNKIVLMMSATPQKLPGYSFIEIDSTFPIETRHWIYNGMGKMSFKHRDKNIPKLAMWLANLQGKTLVHCVSYDTAKKISFELRKIGIYPLLQVNGNAFKGEHSVTRYDAVEAFIKAEDPDKILLSVKLDRGIDFWQPEIINNVLVTVPYPNPTEPLTIAKNRLLGDTWQNEKIAQDIQQSYGRIHRNEKMGIYKGVPTPKRTYIIDNNVRAWYIKNKALFHQWFSSAQLKFK